MVSFLIENKGLVVIPSLDLLLPETMSINQNIVGLLCNLNRFWNE